MSRHTLIPFHRMLALAFLAGFASNCNGNFP
jgi:hypothetical protein